MGFGKSEGPTCVLGPNLKHYVYIHDPVFLLQTCEPLVTPGAMILLDEGLVTALKFISHGLKRKLVLWLWHPSSPNLTQQDPTSPKKAQQ